MSKIVVYKVALTNEGERREIKTVHEDPDYHDVFVSCPVSEFSEDETLLKFKDVATEFHKGEQALIFVTEEQYEAMKDYDEKEKHGG